MAFLLFLHLFQIILCWTWTVGLRSKGYDWLTVIPPVAMTYIGFAVTGTHPVGVIVNLTGMSIILFLFHRGGKGDGRKDSSTQQDMTDVEKASWGRQVAEARCSLL